MTDLSLLESADLSDFERKSLASDEILYLQGQANQGAFIIMSGEIALSRLEDGGSFPVAVIGKGELLGELSAIRGEPHSVTARAVGTTDVLCINSDILEHILRDPLVRFIITTLATRLRDTVNNPHNSPAADALPSSFKVELFPATEITSSIISEPIIITDFPCKIGGRGNIEDAPHQVGAALDLPNERLTQLGSDHFELIMREKHLYLRDLGTPNGTLVNDRKISKFGQEAVCILRRGVSRITCGKEDSEARFVLKISHI